MRRQNLKKLKTAKRHLCCKQHDIKQTSFFPFPFRPATPLFAFGAGASSEFEGEGGRRILIVTDFEHTGGPDGPRRGPRAARRFEYIVLLAVNSMGFQCFSIVDRSCRTSKLKKYTILKF